MSSVRVSATLTLHQVRVARLIDDDLLMHVVWNQSGSKPVKSTAAPHSRGAFRFNKIDPIVLVTELSYSPLGDPNAKKTEIELVLVRPPSNSNVCSLGTWTIDIAEFPISSKPTRKRLHVESSQGDSSLVDYSICVEKGGSGGVAEDSQTSSNGELKSQRSVAAIESKRKVAPPIERKRSTNDHLGVAATFQLRRDASARSELGGDLSVQRGNTSQNENIHLTRDSSSMRSGGVARDLSSNDKVENQKTVQIVNQSNEKSSTINDNNNDDDVPPPPPPESAPPDDDIDDDKYRQDNDDELQQSLDNNSRYTAVARAKPPPDNERNAIDMEGLRKQVEQLRQVNRESELELKKLQESRTKDRAELKRLLSNLRDAKRRIAELTTETAAANTESQNAATEKYKALLASKDATLDGLMKEKKKLIDDLKSAQSLEEEARHAYDISKREIESLNQRLASLQKQQTVVTTSVDSKSNSRIVELERMLGDAQVELEHARDQVAIQEKRANAFKSKIGSANDDLARLSELMTSMENRLVDTKVKYVNAVDRIEELEQANSRLESELYQVRIASTVTHGATVNSATSSPAQQQQQRQDSSLFGRMMKNRPKDEVVEASPSPEQSRVNGVSAMVAHWQK